MFQALLPNLQEALHKQKLVHCVRIMSADCYQVWNYTTPRVAASRHNVHALYQRFSNCGPRTTIGPRALPLWSS
jgi:hypothetical protein